MRILTLATTFPAREGDGTPSFVLDLAAALARHHEVWMLVPRRRGAPAQETLAGVNVVRFPYFPKAWEALAEDAIMPRLRAQPWRVPEATALIAAMSRAARRLAAHIPFDVIHAHWIVPGGLVGARLGRRRGLPMVLTVHGADAFALRGRVAKIVKRRALEAAAEILPVSADIASRIGRPDLTAVPMGVDLGLMKGRQRRPAPGRLLFVGRLAPKKGVAVLLDAVSRVPEASLDILGDGPLRDDLTRHTAALGIADRVDFHGRAGRSRVVSAMFGASVVVIPSVEAAGGDREGTPVVLAEAMACGAPVVASRLGGLGEFVRHGETGFLVTPGSVEELAVALRWALGHAEAAEAVGRRGREQMARSALSLESTTAAYLQAFTRALSP